MTIVFQSVIPRICLQIVFVRIVSFPVTGAVWIIERRGGLVASAKAANVSIIKFIQRSWVALRGDSVR